MSGNSSVAGYLIPDGTAPLYDEALDDIFHDAIAGLTGIPNDLVRPRWQPEPPNQPSFTTNWVAFGITATTPDRYAYERVLPADGGTEQLERDELLEVLLSFYGPRALANSEQFRDGLMLAQNRDALRAFDIGLVNVLEPLVVPALIKEKWVRRVDTRAIFRRRIGRSYKILSLQSGHVHIDAEVTTTDILVTNS